MIIACHGRALLQRKDKVMEQLTTKHEKKELNDMISALEGFDVGSTGTVTEKDDQESDYESDISKAAEKVAREVLNGKRGAQKADILKKRPAKAAQQSAYTLGSHSFGEMKLISAKPKSYIVYRDGDNAKWKQITEITEKHTANHSLACRLLMDYCKDLYITKEAATKERFRCIKKADEMVKKGKTLPSPETENNTEKPQPEAKGEPASPPKKKQKPNTKKEGSPQTSRKAFDTKAWFFGAPEPETESESEDKLLSTFEEEKSWF